MTQLSYSVVTPARNEAGNLELLAASLAAQTLRPSTWLIVDDGSTDDTRARAIALAERHDWVRVLPIPAATGVARGGPVVRAFTAGLAELDPADVVVKLDADVSMEADYFERLLAEFAANERLGIASGSAYERERNAWRQRFGTGTGVWGASRAYRWECLQQVLPLEPRMGWDGIDEHKAQLRGWDTKTFLELPFYHHRGEGIRDGSRFAPWTARGNVAHYFGYRPSYLVFRALFRALRDPAALAMITGYAKARIGREPRIEDVGVRNRVRDQQRVRELPLRALEVLGTRGSRKRGGVKSRVAPRGRPQ